MTALKVVLGILLVLFLLGRIRLGGEGEYGSEGFRARVRVGAIRIRVFPPREKAPGAEEKKRKKKKKQREEAPEEERQKGGTVELALRCLPLIGEAAGELRRKIRIDHLLLDFTAGGADPAGTAMSFGYSNAVIGIILPIFQQNFDLKEYRVRTRMDFTAGRPVLYVNAALSMRLGQLLSLALRLGWKFLKLYLEQRKEIKTEKEAI